MTDNRIARRRFLQVAAAGAASAALKAATVESGQIDSGANSRDYTVACYYFPNYHVDVRNEAQHGPGWTEWELVKCAQPRFTAHQQPKEPLWGYVDEADPEVMAMKIAAAADHAIEAFIFDWYWYNDGPFLQRGLEEGFLRAENNDRLRFAIMWANHTWINIHPHKLHTKPPVQFPGPVSLQTFEAMTDHIISRYFQHPSYWQIQGRPYFSVYSLNDLLESFGTIEQTRAALDTFREKTKAAGFVDLHLNAVVWGQQPILPAEQKPANANELIRRLGFDSFTSYVWIHHVPLKNFPATDYGYVRQEYMRYWRRAERDFDLPYIPNVTMGWDASPRTVQSDRFINAGYPYMATIVNNTPEQFRQSLMAVKKQLQQRGRQKIFNINSWNEWTEGSYLEPDTRHGMAYLEAIKAVFGER